MDLRRIPALAATAAGFASLATAAAPQPELIVFAASSLSQSLGKISEQYASSTGQHVTLSFAASAALTRQIESGSRADVVLCPDSECMDFLEKRKLVDPKTRRDLLRNRLALIAPAGSRIKLEVGPSFPLLAALGEGKLAAGAPDTVQVGRFTRYALISLGVWNAVGDRLLAGDSARSVLESVATGEAPLGVVYETDALLDKRVRIVDVFPSDSHPPISYPMAATPGAGTGAARFMDFLRSSDGRSHFERSGYRPAQ